MYDNYRLASLWQRWVASFYDSLAVFWPMMLGAFGMIGALEMKLSIMGMACYGVGIMGTLCLALMNLRHFCRSGQTWGKQRYGLLVVHPGGARCAPGTLAKRQLAPIICQFIPFLNLVASFDWLTIFGSERRCIHDYLANTVVIEKDSLNGGFDESGTGFNPSGSEEIGFRRF